MRRVVITSAFGLPIFRFRPMQRVAADIGGWCAARLAEDCTPFVLVQTPGPAQSLAHALANRGLAVVADAQVLRACTAYETIGCSNRRRWRLRRAAARRGRPHLGPQSGGRTAGPERHAVAYASGWAGLDAGLAQKKADAGFVFADSADFDWWLALASLDRRELGLRHARPGSTFGSRAASPGCERRRPRARTHRRPRILRRVAAALDLARARRSRIGKEEAIAGALREIAREGDETALATASRIAVGRLLPIGDGPALGVGGLLLLDVVRAATGFDDPIVVACARAAGELAEAFALLAGRVENAWEREGVRLADVFELANALASEPGRASEPRHPGRDIRARNPPRNEVPGQGDWRWYAHRSARGRRARSHRTRVRASPALVRKAAALIADVGELAVLAHQGKLDEARLAVGRPVAFMLATPLETRSAAIAPDAFIVEDKIDGVRAQVHRTDDGEVAVFARGLDWVTRAFPEIVDALRDCATSLVLDGEIVAIGPSGRPRPFQVLQARLKKSRPSEKDIRQTPVALVAFDLLADASGSILHLPWRDRRARLRHSSRRDGRRLSPSDFSELSSHLSLDWALDAAFDAARARGHEGLVLKRADGPYEAGSRGHSWIKVEKGSCDVGRRHRRCRRGTRAAGRGPQ